MSNFEQFRNKLIDNYNHTIGPERKLYVVDVDKDSLWDLYLNSFPEGTNEIFRKRREYDCSCCKSFMREIGPTVWIDDDFQIHSIFEFDAEDEVFQVVANAISAEVVKHPIVDIYLHNGKYNGSTVGRAIDHEIDGNSKIVHTWNHFFIPLREKDVFVKPISNSFSFGSTITIDSLKNDRRTSESVFYRSLSEISEEAIDTVLELIASNSLYRGAEWSGTLKEFKAYQNAFYSITDDRRHNYCWETCERAGNVVTRIRNQSIGVLLMDLSEDVDVEEAVRKYEKIVAPENYHRPKAIFTKKMLENAQKTVESLGLMDSLPRRFATLEDIPVNAMLFSNKDAGKKTLNASNVFDEMASDVHEKKIDFGNARTIGVDDFCNRVLPLSKEVEVYLESRHEKNLCSMIVQKNPLSPTMFKWNNGYSWSYNGNLASSDIRENVKDAGGNVNGDLRFSIQWNDDGKNDNDLDAHCYEPNGGHIYYHRMYSSKTCGELDVDIRYPISQRPGKPAVENITYPSKEFMSPGEYMFCVNCYEARYGEGGFKAEIEFDGKIFRYKYDHIMRTGMTVEVAIVIMKPDGTFEIRHKLPTIDVSDTEMWGLRTNRFVPVTVICNSPNYWLDNGVGAKHLMFMLSGCKNPDCPNGFYNEYLRNDLLVHKRVFEALGSKMAVEPSDDQLSGLGFNLTQRNDLIVKVKGHTQQILKVML